MSQNNTNIGAFDAARVRICPASTEQRPPDDGAGEAIDRALEEAGFDPQQARSAPKPEDHGDVQP